MTDEKNRLLTWLAELERILAPLLPVASPRGCVDPDFRRMVIPSPSPATVEAAIDAVKDYAIRLELTERARRLERDSTDFDCNKRRFHEECRDMGTARERQASGKLSDAPEALRQLRRNLKGDIARLKELIDVAEKGQAGARQSGGQGGTLARIEKAQGEMADALIKQGVTLDRIDANTRPKRTPRGVYKVTQEDAARRVRRSVRTIKDWEAGKHTPEGYSRETRRSLETFTAWALSWQAEQKSKLNTKKAMRYADERGYTFGAGER